MKKVVIDCRYLGMSGIGRFLESILEYLDFNKFEYTLWGKKENVMKYPGCKYIYDDSTPFSAKSLFKAPKKEINKNDVLFTPNFIIPYGIKIRCVAMLHDIIFLDMPQLNSGFKDTLIKKHLIKRGLKKADVIYTVSNFSKDRIKYYFPKVDKKVNVIYPGVSLKFNDYNNYKEKENYVIFVGNVKENKGLDTLVKAFEIVHKKNPELKLFIVGNKDKFRNSDTKIECESANDYITFTGYLSDEEMLDKISAAKYLVQPSTYEGFGLPPLEAMYLNTKPIISDIEVFKEVYSNLDVVYFKNKDYIDLADKILNSNPSLNFNKEEANTKYSHQNNAIEIEKCFEKERN